MDNRTTIDSILRECPRFRILVVGKAGVGKSSLINNAFNVSMASVSHHVHGTCDINSEITSSENPHFVLHDSQGFEPGEVDNLEKVKTFLDARSDNVALEQRVHAVWLCVQIPFAGSAVFESGDEQFLKFGFKAPVIVVFTQFDKLVSRQEERLTDDELELTEDEIEILINQRANDAFQKSCVEQLHLIGSHVRFARVSIKPNHRNTLTNLIDVTQELVAHYIEGDAWIVSAMAQRASVQAKIDGSIEVGMKQYWRGLASSAQFSRASLKDCLSAIHDEIISCWNFNDPDDLLSTQDFREKIMSLVQLVIPEATDMGSWFSQNLERVQSLISVASGFTAALGPAAAAIGLSTMLVQWLANVYKATPEVLRCLMGYIIHLTLVMDQLFLTTLSQKPPRYVSAGQIDIALESYTSAKEVHREIRAYVKEAAFSQILKLDNAQDKVIELIRRYDSG